MTDLTCDVAVIGAGTAGLAAERSARRQGARTLLIDPAFNGTTCATVGCMPSKLLIAAARAAHRARNTALFGVHTGEVRVDGPAVMTRLRAERDRFAASVREGFDNLPEGTRVKARARFTGPATLELDDGRRVEARAVVIATGSSPMVPKPYQALGEAVLTNETVFELQDLPRRLAVIGGGVIGLELAQAMARLGVAVALFDMEERLAGVRDDAVHAALKDAMAEEMELHLGVTPEPRAEDGGVRIDWDGKSAWFERVLVATGRPPNVKGLELEATGLELDDHGMPQVDENTLQCGDAPIFMAGDVNGLRPVLHEASDEGAIAGRNAVAFPDTQRSARKVAFTVTYTEPPLVSVGEAPGENGDRITGHSDYTDQGRASVDGENTGLAKLYADREGRIRGADLFCPGADHLGHLLAWSMATGATAGDLLDQPFYHPTLEEGLRSALRDICEAVPLSPPADRDQGNPPGV
ncbi:dihydrolipoyl dehydrogenase (plasmid) [Sagittula sp. P11]|uniref:dihydrolipoyl dehydrogenase n=1 Tax=Sagittula sp. P11 TaxID=2009329 RepID=UPI000C2D218F|nr:dihydrolipoyl dehydrogenase [Sagittula sp. P11]AUC56778.1 dihydrolipoyl dehydrogenase [Sagittula sp. P11]